MENNKEIVLTDGTEKTDETVEETTGNEESKKEVEKSIKTYNDTDVDEIVGKKLTRAEKKYERELERIKKSYETKYGELEATLKAGMEVDDIDTATEKLKEFYEGQGTKIPKKTDKLTEKQIEILGKAEAKDVIELGIDEMNAEAQRLADIGYDNLSGVDQVVFGELVRTLTYEKKKNELKDKDVDTSILESNDFNEFASQFNDNVSITQIYQMFEKTSKKQVIT